jgi:hypothetical protein
MKGKPVNSNFQMNTQEEEDEKHNTIKSLKATISNGLFTFKVSLGFFAIHDISIFLKKHKNKRI